MKSLTLRKGKFSFQMRYYPDYPQNVYVRVKTFFRQMAGVINRRDIPKLIAFLESIKEDTE